MRSLLSRSAFSRTKFYRPPWRQDYGPERTKRGIAQFRYDAATMTSSLWWSDRNGKWLRVPDATPAGDVDRLLRIVDENRTGAFE